MNHLSPPSRSDLRQILAESGPVHHPHRWWPWAVVTLGAMLALGALLLVETGSGQRPRYLTEAAITGDLTVTVSATGTLEPTKSVDVGSELSGRVAQVLVQENDRVVEGQLLAVLDTAKLEDAVTKAEAAVAAAEAGVAEARATSAEAKATLSRLRRVSVLSDGKVPAKIELETAEAALRRAEAAETSAEAAVLQARAQLQTDRTSLSKATIRAPVDGVVLTRSVEPGNTVVASMTTPVLFVIAEDLSQMELHVQVDEADVARVAPGQNADFSVAAWPDRTFSATVRRVDLGSETIDNVVTYETTLGVDNSRMALRPGMTATATITTARREKALLVPNAALRFVPGEATQPNDGPSGILAALLPQPPRMSQSRKAEPSGSPTVWVVGADGDPVAVPVRTGLSDGRWTEVLGGDITPGMQLITDREEAKT